MKKKNNFKNEKIEKERRMLERRRVLDYVSLQGLSTQTGCDSTNLDSFVLKELVDNAFDACEGTNPTVEVAFDTEGQFLTLTVKDNGKGLTEADIERITDFERSYSTKFHYKYPTRGALGNALKCVLGIPYALTSEYNIKLPNVPIRIRSKGKEHDVCLSVQEFEERVDCQVSSRDTESKDGTEVSITFFPFREYWGDEYLDLIRGYVLFNPDADIKFTLKHPKLEKPSIEAHKAIIRKPKKFTGTSSIHWYTLSQFKQLVQAYIRSIETGERDLTLREFIKQFRGLTSDEKVTSVLEEIEVERRNIRMLSTLSGQNEIISQLYEVMKKHSYEPRADVLGEISRKHLKNRIRQIYGELQRPLKYKKFKEVYREGTCSVPYVLEVAMAVLKDDISLKIHTGINHSPCLGNPFEGYHVKWMDKKGNKQEASLMEPLLEKYGIKSEQPVVIVVHLICPNIEYESYGKGKINTSPFIYNLAQVLTDVCRFYPRYKRRKWSISGRTSLARVYLVEELKRRETLLSEYGTIPEGERTTQQGIYYTTRNLMRGEIDILRSSFISAIRDECENMGRKRAELGILTAVRAELYHRGKVYPVSLDNISTLARMGSDVIIVEKEGVCEVLEPFANQRGVALVNSRGFVVEYAKDLLALSKEEKANLFILTDYDASGLLIAQKLPSIPRLGVDPQMISSLGLKQQDVEEKYSAPKKHLKHLPQASQSLVKDKRIEIDAVLAAAEPKKLWNYLEEKMLELAHQRDMTRSMDLTIKLPPEISSPFAKITEFVQSVGTPKQEQFKAELTKWEKGFLDVERVEENIQSKIIEEIRKDDQIQELAKQLNKLTDSISKNS